MVILRKTDVTTSHTQCSFAGDELYKHVSGVVSGVKVVTTRRICLQNFMAAALVAIVDVIRRMMQ